MSADVFEGHKEEFVKYMVGRFQKRGRLLAHQVGSRRLWFLVDQPRFYDKAFKSLERNQIEIIAVPFWEEEWDDGRTLTRYFVHGVYEYAPGDLDCPLRWLQYAKPKSVTLWENWAARVRKFHKARRNAARYGVELDATEFGGIERRRIFLEKHKHALEKAGKLEEYAEKQKQLDFFSEHPYAKEFKP